LLPVVVLEEWVIHMVRLVVVLVDLEQARDLLFNQE
jgi:hypothetical protein